MVLQKSRDFHVQSIQSVLLFKPELDLCTVTNILSLQYLLIPPPSPKFIMHVPIFIYLTMVGTMSGPSVCLSSRRFR